jgi:hypothetical protein
MLRQEEGMTDNRSVICPGCGGWMEFDDSTEVAHCDTCDYYCSKQLELPLDTKKAPITDAERTNEEK